MGGKDCASSWLRRAQSPAHAWHEVPLAAGHDQPRHPRAAVVFDGPNFRSIAHYLPVVARLALVALLTRNELRQVL
jgi:hypothetical protein